MLYLYLTGAAMGIYDDGKIYGLRIWLLTKAHSAKGENVDDHRTIVFERKYERTPTAEEWAEMSDYYNTLTAEEKSRYGFCTFMNYCSTYNVGGADDSCFSWSFQHNIARMDEIFQKKE